MDDAFSSASQAFGPIHILVSNAGFVNSVATLSELDVEDAWTGFEVHCKGIIHLAQAFSRTIVKNDAVVIHTSSIVAILPAFPGASVYMASKLAADKLWTYFGAENPGVRVVSYQPGQLNTPMSDKLGLAMPDHSTWLCWPCFVDCPANMDQPVDLPGHFVVWLSSPEAQFLNGKFACANWDIDELLARKSEFETTNLGTLVFKEFL